MSRSITIDGVERADLTRLESFSFQETAYRGEVGQGGFSLDSEALAVDVLPWQNTLATDSDGGRFFTGQTIDRGLGRGSFTTDADAQWDVQCVDYNTIMDDPLLLGAGANRPAETDVQRMQWLVGDLVFEGYPIGDDYLETGSAEDMDAQDYRGQFPRSVADECAENSGKGWYLFYDVGVTDQIQLMYGALSYAGRSSAYRISSVDTDIDDYGVTWPAEWPEENALQRDPSRIYSGVQIQYGSSSKVFVARPATAVTYKKRETTLFDASVKTETAAIKLANHYLDAAETEDLTITVAVTVPTTHVNAFLQGQRISCRFPHLGIAGFTWIPCIRRTVEPAGESENRAPDRYHVILTLKPAPKSTRYGGRGTAPPDDTAGGPDTPVPIDVTGACATGDPRDYRRFDDLVGTSGETLGGSGSGTVVGSAVWYNVPYTDLTFPCPIGGGSWRGFIDEQIVVQYTAPADDPTAYLGLQTVIDASGVDISGRVFGYEVLAFPDDASAVTWANSGTPVADGVVGSVFTVTIPRSAVAWGAFNCLILRPVWECDRPIQFCNQTGYFGGPGVDGRGNSGSYEDFAFAALCAIQLTAGMTGQATNVAGVGAVDGANATFFLIGWDGTGGVVATINGLPAAATDFTLDTGAFTVTFTSPPPANSAVLFTYHAVT